MILRKKFIPTITTILITLIFITDSNSIGFGARIHCGVDITSVDHHFISM